MSQENVERHRQVMDAFNQRDIDALLAFADPNVEFIPRLLELEGGGPYRGHDGIRSWWESWLAFVPDFHSEMEKVQDLGDVTLAREHFRGHGAASGTTVEQALWQVAEWREQKCVSWHVFLRETEALEAAGVQE